MSTQEDKEAQRLREEADEEFRVKTEQEREARRKELTVEAPKSKAKKAAREEPPKEEPKKFVIK
jgi:hypothetical protein